MNLSQLAARNLRSRHFWIITLAALAVCLLTARLSVWQWQRSISKQQLATQLQNASQQAPWDETHLLRLLQSAAPLSAQNDSPAVLRDLSQGLPDTKWLYQPVQLRGNWLAQHTVYAENRQMNQRVGFWVYTPFQLANQGATIMVLRGFVPRNLQDRTALPAIATPQESITLHAQLLGAPSQLPSLGVDTPAQAGKPDIRLNIDLPSIAREKQIGLLPFTLRETQHGQSDGLLRHWDAPNLGIAKHQGYAFQWAAMCLTVLLLYLWFQWIRPLRALKP